ncbi:MAG: DegV family protein [Oscillospiraceae bacterium]|nr:DegV family protein [Oscillospiraceae bacterium]
MCANYKIVVDSTTDLPPYLAEEWGLTVIPFLFTLDGADYYNHLDHHELSLKDFYNALRDGKTGSTTQVNTFRYIETWEPVLQAGQDILYLCLSSALSKSYDQSLLAVAELKEKYPERQIISIDSRSASLGQGALAYYAVQGRDAGKNLAENAAYLEDMIPRFQVWIMADDLHHLRRGGRVSGAQAFLGTMLGVKPILTIFEDGRIGPVHKVRGRLNALDYFLERMEAQGVDPTGQLIGIAHSDVPEMAEQLREMLTAKYGAVEFLVNDIGPVIGMHTGPGTVGMMFLGDVRE